MRALILAAGQGKRLGKASKNQPKCLVELFGKPIISKQLETLKSNNIRDINIVTGYKSNLLDKLNLNTYHNKDFEKTNMVFSMFQASELFDSNETDLIVAYGDIIYEKGNLNKLIKSKSSISIMVDLNWRNLWSKRFDNPLDDAETMIKDFYIKIQNSNLIDYKNLYMTDFLQLLINNKIKVSATLVKGGWLEIDTEKDIICYENLYKNGELNRIYNY